MKIQIIGLGIVGTAQAYLSQKLGHIVIGYDPIKKTHPYCTIVKNIEDSDITFICTPESVIENIVKDYNGNSGLIVIKSTVPIGTTNYLSKKYNIHICHNPEFLRERYSIEDVMNPSRIVIGVCCDIHGNMISEFYKNLNKQIYLTDTTTSETIKIVSNSFRAVTITFWNQISLLCKEKNIDITEVSEICDPSKLIGEWEGGKWGTRFFLRPYDGKCLPKDIRYLINSLNEHGCDASVLEMCEKFNNRLNKKIIEGI